MLVEARIKTSLGHWVINVDPYPSGPIDFCDSFDPVTHDPMTHCQSGVGIQLAKIIFF